MSADYRSPHAAIVDRLRDPKLSRLTYLSLADEAADEIEALREVVRTVSSVLGDPLQFSDERLGRAVQRALGSGSEATR